ncbi:hypothetical protein ACLOJK_037838 [Asimina triloba]
MEDSSFSKLTRLEIRGSVIQREQNNLPGLGQLPALKRLQIENVGLKKVGRELYYGNLSNDVVGGGGREAFAKLEELVLEKMSELEEWELMSEFDADVRIMPSLSILRLENCPKLVGLPDHFANAPLKTLVISGCDRLKSRGCSSSFSHLEKFTLDDSSEFFSNLPIGGWEQLSLPEGLTQLQSLENHKIVGCNKVRLLPKGLGQLKKLQSLRIRHLEVLTRLPDSLGQWESLERLEILDSENLQSLPEGLGEHKKLKSLKIRIAEALICLPDSLGQLESLERLEILDSKNLQSLPEGLGELKKLKEVRQRRKKRGKRGKKKKEKRTEEGEKEKRGRGKEEGEEKKRRRRRKEIRFVKKNIDSYTEPNWVLVLRLGLDEILVHQDVEVVSDLLYPTAPDSGEMLPDFPVVVTAIAQLESLERLKILDSENLQSLPEGLGELKKLKSLKISNAEALICLPNSLAQFESLERLKIHNSKNLQSLPEGLEMQEGRRQGLAQDFTHTPNYHP